MPFNDEAERDVELEVRAEANRRGYRLREDGRLTDSPGRYYLTPGDTLGHVFAGGSEQAVSIYEVKDWLDANPDKRND